MGLHVLPLEPIAPDPARQEASGGFAAGEAFIEPSAGDR
jgi:hypothetical protein